MSTDELKAEFPALPEPMCHRIEWTDTDPRDPGVWVQWHDSGDLPTNWDEEPTLVEGLFNAYQLRAYVLADRAARAPASPAVAEKVFEYTAEDLVAEGAQWFKLGYDAGVAAKPVAEKVGQHTRHMAMLLALTVWRQFPETRDFIERRTGPWFVMGSIRDEWEWRADVEIAEFDSQYPVAATPPAQLVADKPATLADDSQDAARWRMIRDGDPSIAIELVGGSAFGVGWDAYVDVAIAAAKESP